MNGPHDAHRLPITTLLLVAVTLAGCFEEPVTEELELRFPNGAAVDVTAKVTLRVPAGDAGHAALLVRLDALERDLLGGTSAWSHRFGVLEATREGQAWQREEGRLAWFRQWATADPTRLTDFFVDTPVQVSYQLGEGGAELAFYPGSGSRATEAERHRVEKALGPWLDAVAAYEAAAFRLWEYLDSNPERRRACIGRVFGSELEEGEGEGEGEKLPPTTAAEDALLEPLGEAMDGVAVVLQLPEEEGETLEELARRVYDPYPARMRVVVEGEVLAAENLVRSTDKGWEVPQRSPWAAFRALGGHWLTPDPLLARIEHMRKAGGQHFDLDGFLAQPFRRSLQAPTAAAVRRLLLAGLAAPGTSRLAWRPKPAPATPATDPSR